MSELKRKKARRSTRTLKHQKYANISGASQRRNSTALVFGQHLHAAHLLLGLALACYLGYTYASHAKQLHENELWFSHITVSAHAGMVQLTGSCLIVMHSLAATGA